MFLGNYNLFSKLGTLCLVIIIINDFIDTATIVSPIEGAIVLENSSLRAFYLLFTILPNYFFNAYM